MAKKQNNSLFNVESEEKLHVKNNKENSLPNASIRSLFLLFGAGPEQLPFIL